MSFVTKSILKKIKLRTWIALGVTAVLLPIAFVALFTPNSPEASWFDDSYAYRAKITFTHNAAVNDDRRVSITVDTAALTTDKMQADCDDTRFTDISGKVLRFQTVSGCDTNSTVYDVVVEEVFNGSNVLYIYYGNPLASSASEDVSSVTSLSPSGGSPALGTEEKGEGPIAYWKFDEGYGTTAQDTTSGNKDGAFGASTAAPTWKTEDMCVSHKCLFFDGSNDTITVSGTIGGVQSVSFWVRPSTTTEQFLALNGSAYISSSSGTISATGFTSPTIYVDGKVSDTIVANAWQHIVVTTGTEISASAITLGNQSTNFGQVFLDEVKLYNYALSAQQVKVDHNRASSAIVGYPSTKYLSDGLVGYWNMNEVATPSADSSGNGNNGTWSNTAYAVGKYGNATDYNGTNAYTSIADTAVLDPTGDMTISTWVKFDTIPSVKADAEVVLAKPHSASPWVSYLIKVEPDGDGITFIWSSTASNFPAYSTTSVAASTWYHIVGVKSGSNVSIYVNGVHEHTNSSVTGTALDSDQALRIGSGDGEDYLDGQVDDVRLYNRALSPTEISNLYRWAPGPVGYWDFNEGSGTSAYDKSGNNLTATLTYIDPPDSIPTWVSGYQGKGLNFDDTDDNATVFYNTLLDFTSNFTVSTWVKPESLASSSNTILVKGLYAPSRNYSLYFALDEVKVSWNDGTDWREFVTTSADIAVNQWYYLTYVRRMTTETIYINGVPEVSQNIVYPMIANDQRLDFGSRGTGDPAQDVFDGTIDEIRIYNYARSQEQILQDMAGSGPTSSGTKLPEPVSYYSFDEQNGQTLNNKGIGGSAYNGTLGATSGASTDDPTWKTESDCKINGCLDFDGTDDVVTVTNATAIDLNDNLSSGLTFSAWIYPDTVGEGSAGEIFVKSATTYCRLGGTAPFNLSCSLDLGTDATVTVNSVIPASTWTHVAMSWTDDSDDEITVWVNGLPRGASTNGVGPTSAESSNLLVGGGTSNNFDGKIDDFKVYSSELTGQQVLLEMNAASSVNYGNTSVSEATLLSDGAGNPPIAHWSLDEKAGTTAYDKSGTGSNLSISGATWARGKSGSALSFDGSNDNASSAINGTALSALSVSLWVHPLSTQSTQVGIFSWGNTALSATPFIQFSRSASSTNTTVYVDGNFRVTTSIPNDTWTHFAITLTSSHLWTFYVNGAVVGGYQDDATRTYQNLATSVYLASGYNAYFHGMIDEVKIYNYARTQAQVAYDFNRGAPVAHWKLDECEGGTAYDSSGNGNHGTLTVTASGGNTNGAGTCETSTSAWGTGSSGKYGSSLFFDGDGDYVDTGGTSTLTTASTMTISAWIKVASHDNSYREIVRKGSSPAWMLLLNDDNEISMSTSNVSGEYDSGYSFPADDEWHFVAGTFDGSTIRIYLDGIGVASYAGDALSKPEGNIIIGSAGGTTQFFTGQIDDVRIYNYALSPSQIDIVMNDASSVRFGPNEGNP